MTTVLIKSGTYRNQPVVNQTFTLVKEMQSGAKGNFVTVKNDGQFNIDIEVVRVTVNGRNDFEIFGEGTTHAPTTSAQNVFAPVVITETDEEAMDRIATRFQILDEMAGAAIAGEVRGIVVSGPPGVGKSFGIEAQLEKSSLFDRISNNKIRYEFVKGAATALGIYIKLYEFSDAKNVLVFDDCDSVWTDELALNIMKAALDTSKRRRISWNSDSRLLREEGIPNTFEFKGSVIFITNLKFDNVKSGKLRDHIAAIESRCHFLDLTIDTDRDKILRLKQVHRDAQGGLFADYSFSTEQQNEILNYIDENKSKFREISMRLALKIADLVKISPKNWKHLAENTVMRRHAA